MTGNELNIPTGFDFLQMRRDGLHHWHVLSKLAQFGKNREAAAIVESFQSQMDLEAQPAPINITNAA